MASKEVRPPAIANQIANLVRIGTLGAAALGWLLISTQVTSAWAQVPGKAARRPSAGTSLSR